nr:MAG TPA: hypothetical protein [Caudoviricetes sp.]DAO82059.1 MAG TPA: hypothetical protein [Caudoviricetes sp.]
MAMLVTSCIYTTQESFHLYNTLLRNLCQYFSLAFYYAVVYIYSRRWIS